MGKNQRLISRNIPDELIWNIVLSLPASSVNRFRTVCKPWLNLIQSPPFIKAHVEKTARINTIDDRLIVISTRDMTRMYAVNFNSGPKIMNLDYPHKDPEKVVILVGSSNGLICFENTNLQPTPNSRFRDCNYPSSDAFFTLWNPCTGIHRIVSDKSKSRDSWVTPAKYTLNVDSHCYFGYDRVNEDYHVVRVTMPLTLTRDYGHQCTGLDFAHHLGFVIDIHSLKSDSWIKIHDQSKCLVYAGSGVFIDGTLYLVAQQLNQNIDDGHKFKIFALDIATRNFRFIELPQGAHPRSGRQFILNELHGCLVVTHHSWYKKKHVVWLLSKNKDEDNDDMWKETPLMETEEEVDGTSGVSNVITVIDACGDNQEIVQQVLQTVLQVQGRPTEQFLCNKLKSCLCLKTFASPFLV